MGNQTLFDKLWEAHTVRDIGQGWALLHVDRHLMHDLGGGPAFADMAKRGLKVHNPELTFATPDHAVASAPGRTSTTFPLGGRLYKELRDGAESTGVKFFEIGRSGHGIVHVMAPEQGIVLPGMSVVCTDSHTCTNGGLGALAFGIGTSESVHVLATQTVRQHKPSQMRIRCEGSLGPGVTAKDLALYIIGKLGAAAGAGYAVEYAGSTIEALDVEERLTLCNLTVELGARFGLIAPDERTFAWVANRPLAPVGVEFEDAVAYWRTLYTDTEAVFDREVIFDATDVVPMITWGTSPEHAIPVDGNIPSSNDKATFSSEHEAALEYMGLPQDVPIAGTPVDWVFIGSCANSRLSDLRAAGQVVRGRHVAPGVKAWVVPGSEDVKRAAEGEGLHLVFKEAGFEWREPGCSMCVAANGEQVSPGERSVSTSNRNFVGRQGPGARTHLASPITAAAAAIAGFIIDPRELA